MSTPWDWSIKYAPGDTCRTVMWSGKEVAVVNPRGDFTEETEANLAVGIAFSARMHRALKRIARDRYLSDDMLAEICAIKTDMERTDPGRYDADLWDRAYEGSKP